MAQVPVGGRVDRAGQLPGWLALGFAALLALSPFARPSLPGHMAWAEPTTVRSLALHEHALPWAEESAPRPHADRADPGLLPRASSVEATFAPPPDKGVPIRPALPDPPLAAPASTGGSAGDPLRGFHRSAIGTARTPTGPPA
jgi:hypothetical protein